MKTLILSLFFSILSFFFINAQPLGQSLDNEQIGGQFMLPEGAHSSILHFLLELECYDKYHVYWNGQSNTWIDTFSRTHTIIKEEVDHFKIEDIIEVFDTIATVWKPFGRIESLYFENPFVGLSPRLDSSITMIWDETAQSFKPANSLKILYSSTNKPFQKTYYRDLSDTGLQLGFSAYLREISHYNVFDNIDYSLHDVINYSTGDLLNQDSTIYNYDVGNNLVESITYLNSNGIYSLNRRGNYVNNLEGMPLEYISQNWDGAEWINFNRTLYEYDSLNRQTRRETLTWNGTLWSPPTIELIYEYDGVHKISEIYNTYDDLGELVGSALTTYFYDPQSGKITTEILKTLSLGTYMNRYRIDYIYCTPSSLQNKHRMQIEMQAYFLGNDYLHIKTASNFFPKKIALIGMDGKRTVLGEMTGEEATFKLRELSSGVYSVLIIANDGFALQKVFKQ